MRDLPKSVVNYGERVCLLIAPAESTRYIAYTASIEDVKVYEDQTHMIVSQLHRVFEDHKKKSSVRKASDGSGLHPDFIRPYAICYTPAWVK